MQHAPSGTRRAARMLPPERWFAAAAALALALHALLLFGVRGPGVRGGADLVPHLRVMQRMREDPGLHTVYAPFYDALGAVLVPWLGADLFTRLFALLAAAALIFGFRAFQRAAGLPAASSALFALMPYLFSLSHCIPKVEALGYALLLTGLAQLLKGRHIPVALLTGALFWIHTASAQLFGLTAGVLCLARRDVRGLVALALGTLGAAPLWAAHLAAGCSPLEALRIAAGGYTRSLADGLLGWNARWLLPLANPVALAIAALGAPEAWRQQRAPAILAAALVVLYLNNLWLAPFGVSTQVDLFRGLALLAIAVAIAGGSWIAERPKRAAWALGLSAAWAVGAALVVVPRACYVRPISAAELSVIEVRRCTYQWVRVRRHAPAPRPHAPAVRGEAAP